MRSLGKCLWVLCLVVSLAGPASVTARGHGPRLHQLWVGVSAYSRLPQTSQLRFAHQDALDLEKVFRARHGQGKTLVNGEATLGSILANLEELCRRAESGDLAIVLLSGHGGFGGPTDSEWYFLPHDADSRDLRGTALSARTLHEYLNRLAKNGVTVILLLDACHCGAMTLEDPVYAILAGCQPSQLCMEPPELGNGAFTRAVLEAFQGEADANHDGTVTLQELQDYVSKRLQQYQTAGFLRRHGRQNPVCVRPAFVAGELPLFKVGSP